MSYSALPARRAAQSPPGSLTSAGSRRRWPAEHEAAILATGADSSPVLVALGAQGAAAASADWRRVGTVAVAACGKPAVKAGWEARLLCLILLQPNIDGICPS